jgi:hypothetical protein
MRLHDEMHLVFVCTAVQVVLLYSALGCTVQHVRVQYAWFLPLSRITMLTFLWQVMCLRYQVCCNVWTFQNALGFGANGCDALVLKIELRWGLAERSGPNAEALATLQSNVVRMHAAGARWPGISSPLDVAGHYQSSACVKDNHHVAGVKTCVWTWGDVCMFVSVCVRKREGRGVKRIITSESGRDRRSIQYSPTQLSHAKLTRCNIYIALHKASVCSDILSQAFQVMLDTESDFHTK